MLRANRYFIPGYIWHITHRCHQEEFPGIRRIRIIRRVRPTQVIEIPVRSTKI